MFIHLKRKNIRLINFDYSNQASYFITLCEKNKKNIFGKIIHNSIHLNDIGRILEFKLKELPEIFDFIQIDTYIIMPNHIHLIINLYEEHNSKNIALAKIIGYYKSSVTKDIMKKFNIESFWQKRFFDHIIRNEISLNKIREYIENNPKNWNLDEYFD